MIAALIATMLQVAAPATALPCTQALCDADRLAPVFAKLRSARGSGRIVRIVQIGDSHTAADQVTGSWRTLLQARFGRGGRGVLPPGRPYAGYLTRDITATQTGPWTTAGIFGSARHPGGGPLGLTGYTLSTDTPGATIGLRADRAELGFDRFTVCALTGPNAGSVSLTIGGVQQRWSLAAPTAGSDCTTLTSPLPVSSAGVTVTQGPVALTSWSTEVGTGGVTLSNLGTVGAQLLHFDRTDDSVVTRELAQYRPDLIVVAFGTNEAFYPRFTTSGYDAQLQASLRRLQRLAPGVPMLLIGAPDSATRLPSLQTGAAGVSLPCGEGEWRPTAALASVQAIQRTRAHQLGLAYWDWSQRMGGRCAATDWATQVPPLMRGDRVHFTSPGAARIAGWLEADLEAAMAKTVADPAAAR